MATIFDLVTSAELVAYWNELPQEQPPFFAESLFPSQKKLGLNLKWIKGSKGLVKVLNLSAFDSKVVPRDRIGFATMQTSMPFFKESMLIDEEMRQELNMVLETGNTGYIDSVMNMIFDDQATLLAAARNQRERMRMQLITSGVIALSSNGQDYVYDYGLDAGQKPTVTKSWSDPTADIIGDITAWQLDRQNKTGVKPSRAVVSQKTWGYLKINNAIKNSLYVIAQAGAQFVMSDAVLRNYLSTELGLEVVVYTKSFIDEAGATKLYMPDDTFVLLPAGTLGNTWFGTTPEESDLRTQSSANVTVADVGVAVTSMRQVDPVNVETKVSQIVLPSFEQSDKIVIADVIA